MWGGIDSYGHAWYENRRSVIKGEKSRWTLRQRPRCGQPPLRRPAISTIPPLHVTFGLIVMLRRTSLLFALSCLLLLSGVSAQFGNFFQGGGFHFPGQNPFGGGQEQQQQQGGRSHKGWQEAETGEHACSEADRLWQSGARQPGRLTRSALRRRLCLPSVVSLCTHAG